MRVTLLIITMLVASSSVHAADNLKTTNIQRYYMPVRLFLQAAAQLMPAEKYTFKLDP